MCDFGTGQVAERAWGEAGKFLGRVVCGTRAAGAQGLAAGGWTLKTALVVWSNNSKSDHLCRSVMVSIPAASAACATAHAPRR